MSAEQKRKIQWAVSLFLMMLYFSGLTAQAQYEGGSGKPNDPYLIYTAEQMNAIGTGANDWDKHFKLMADIDLAAYTGDAFNIIGYWVDLDSPDNKPFTGVFDGNGKKISNLTYTSKDANEIGLFGYVSGENAVVKDLGLINPNIDVDAGTGDRVGSLVGYLASGTITNCYVEGGSVSGDEYAGGLLGWNGGRITNCYAVGSVSGSAGVGGLVGTNEKGTISNSYSTGRVTGGGASAAWRERIMAQSPTAVPRATFQEISMSAAWWDGMRTQSAIRMPRAALPDLEPSAAWWDGMIGQSPTAIRQAPLREQWMLAGSWGIMTVPSDFLSGILKTAASQPVPGGWVRQLPRCRTQIHLLMQAGVFLVNRT